MRFGFYPKLAITTIRKNRKLYLPYILTCIGMITMFYIISSLCDNPLYKEMGGGGSLNMIMHLGQFVVAVFAFIFLFYTNSFLVRRRNREFGLYNVLGMDKSRLATIATWEALIIGVISLVSGLFLGILLSKLADMGLMKVIRHETTMDFRIPYIAVVMTLLVFVVIFLVILVSSFIKIRRTNALNLMNSENVGEKPPKGNFLIAVTGIILLGGAYVIAVSIKSPLDALSVFFIAVIMVIIATYMLFTTGSVTLCRVLKKNKGYYYKKSHFVSVSSMSYRMKRNGAGLASICILCTMVLVVLSSTVSLFIGSEESFKTRYPMDLCYEINAPRGDKLSDDSISKVRDMIDEELDAAGLNPSSVLDYEYASFYGNLDGGNLKFENPEVGVRLISVEAYNKMTGKDLQIAADAALVTCIRTEYNQDKIKIGDSREIRIIGTADDIQTKGIFAADILPSIYLVVGDFDGVLDELNSTQSKDFSIVFMCADSWSYSFNVDGDIETQLKMHETISNKLGKMNDQDLFYSYSNECAEKVRDDFYESFGGLFFIGVLLSIVFMFATVLIVYYKQITEGYEDQKNFQIMQMVGMNKDDIKKSINSQVLTVFFAPLIFAVLHMSFAFPLIWKMLQMFNLYNLTLIIAVTVITIIVFGLIYAIVYKITSSAYYRIVAER